MPRPIREPIPKPPKLNTYYRQYNITCEKDSSILDKIMNDSRIDVGVLTTTFNDKGNFIVVCTISIPENEKELMGEIL